MTQDPLSPEDLRLIAFGRACRIVANSPLRGVSIGAVFAWLWPPVRLGQVIIAHDSAGKTTGFATWAFLTEKVADEYVANGVAPALPDWNEGDQLWIMSLVAAPGQARSVVGALAAVHASRHCCAHFLKRRGRGRSRVTLRVVPAQGS